MSACYLLHIAFLLGLLLKLLRNVGWYSPGLLTYLLTYGAEPFLKSRQLCSPSRTSQHFVEPEVSIPCSQEPSSGPYLSHIHPIHSIPSYLSKIHFNIVHPSTSWSSQWSLSFWLGLNRYMLNINISLQINNMYVYIKVKTTKHLLSSVQLLLSETIRQQKCGWLVNSAL
jgi:hypothetical protein